MKHKIVSGTIKNNTHEDYLKPIEGIKVVCYPWPDGYYSVCGGADDENADKLMKELFKTIGKDEGIKTLKEFRELWEAAQLEGIGLHKDNLEDVEVLASIDQE
ncbi:hypothetical protein [Vallitalea guaymasensis]|uniref:hypothetical protein n=1 Tax=Vallitalea guaymasensis TaxID=1185412 RepID=UPI000DE48DC7|nr:hypothetical protein [Vallitalea guaymasensis]